MRKNILITGGAGFIGSSIVEHLVENNLYTLIHVLDNLSTGKLNNIQKYINSGQIEYMCGDITDINVCKKAMKNMDCVCHLAAFISVPNSLNDPQQCHNINVNGFLNILTVARKNNIKRIVYSTSSAVYGDDDLPYKQENIIGNSLSPYATTKYINELYANLFTTCYGMECIGLRYFNVYGPRQNPNDPYAAVISKFIELMKNNKPPTIFGDGSFSRDFIYVDDVVQANILALTTLNKECYGNVFNIGTCISTTILELAKIIKNELNFKGDINFDKSRLGDIPHSCADITKAQTMLKYNPKINFIDGIKKLLNYLAP